VVRHETPVTLLLQAKFIVVFIIIFLGENNWQQTSDIDHFLNNLIFLN